MCIMRQAGAESVTTSTTYPVPALFAMTHPLVSVGVPAYNEGRHLARTLDSLLAQSYPHLEIIVSDNASTDDTGGIARAYARRDYRVRYHCQRHNVGASLNFNRTLELSRGDFFHWAAGHDDHPPDLIERCVEVLCADPTVSLCYTSAHWEDGSDASGSVDTRGEGGPLERLRRVLCGTSGGAVYGVYRTEMLRRTLLIEQVVASDVLLLAELSTLGSFAYLPEPALILKQAEDYGDWSVYVKKIFGEVPPHLGRLYWQAMMRLCLRAGRHLPVSQRPRAYTLAARVFRSRFGWIREGLAAAGGERTLLRLPVRHAGRVR